MVSWWARLTRIFAKRSSSALLAFSSVGSIMLAFLRGVLLARLLPPKEFGIAITATIVMGVAELVTDIGINQLAVKSKSAEDLGTFHALAVIRGVILCIVVAACGPLFGILFHSEGAAWIYVVVGIVLLIKSFSHLEVKLLTRSYQYLPEAAASLASHILWTVVTVWAAILLRDYRAMTFGIVAYAVGYVVITHALVKTPWRLRWNPTTVREATAFGRPLALNGIAYSIISLGDRTLTGAKIGLVDLAHYTALSTSAFLPRSAIGGFLNSLFLPHFVNAAGEEDLGRVADLWFIGLSFLAGTFGCVYLATGRVLTGLVFGQSYEVEQTLVSLVGILGTIRYLTCLPSPPAMAFSRSSLMLQFTLLSTSGLALGAILIFQRPSLELLVLGMSIGEAATLFWLIVQLKKFLPLTNFIAFGSMSVPLALTSVCAVGIYELGPSHPVKHILICLLACGAHFACCLVFLRAARLNPRDLVVAVLPSRRSFAAG